MGEETSKTPIGPSGLDYDYIYIHITGLYTNVI